MSHLFGNSSHKPLFTSPESTPWNTPSQHTREATARQNLPRNSNKFTKYYGVRAPYDTADAGATRMPKKVPKDTPNLIVPEQRDAPSFSPTMKRSSNISTLASEERQQKTRVTNARLERRREYQKGIEERKQQMEEKARRDWDNRREAKAMQRQRYEKVFEEKNQRFKNRPTGRKAYDKNMTIEEMRKITRGR